MHAGRPSRTACQNALFRALESRRPAGQRVADDTLAADFLTPEFRLVAELARVPALRRSTEAYIDRRWPCARGGVVARTRLLDDTVTAEASRAWQVLILGAGFDSRPYRLPALRDMEVFEVDHPDTQALKRRVLGRRGRALPRSVHLVPVDFGRDDTAQVLESAGFRTGVPTLVLWEGTTNYLHAEVVDETFWLLASSIGPGSPVLFTYVHAGVLDGTVGFEGGPTTMRAVRKVGEPMTFGFDPSDVPGYLGDHGFDLEWDVEVSELGRRGYWDHPPSLPAYYHVALARRR
ncbi:MAG TPA: SAM-dependent methyltransferase [Acidimicrobiales bacterium]|nr:SAM-dependent methyltransferase [Acidimicrobiales bacterium]